MAITLLTSSPGEVGIDEIRTKVNEVLQTLSLSASPLTSSPGQTSIDTVRVKINELIAEANAGGGSSSSSSSSPSSTTGTVLTVSGESILLTDGTTLDLA